MSHADEILDNMKSYDYTKEDFLTIGNYYDFAHILDVDTRLFKDVDLKYYAKTVIELIGVNIKQVIKDAEAGDFSIVRVGGSIGEVKTGRIGGTMVKVIESDLFEDVAKQKVKDLNSGLSAGDKSYYGIKYKAVKTSTIRS